MSGEWRQHEVFDGTYIVDDLIDWHEMKIVKNENERRFREWEKIQKGS
jgi:hypothetical protein